MSNKQIYVLYGSQTGNAKEIASQIYYSLLEQNPIENLQFCSLNETLQNGEFLFVNKEHCEIFVIIVCSTTGNGDAPETANHFWRKVKDRKHPLDLFQNIKYAVLGLGDTNYNRFCQMGKNLDRRFGELGALRIVDLTCADEAIGLEESVELFKSTILHYFS